MFKTSNFHIQIKRKNNFAAGNALINSSLLRGTKICHIVVCFESCSVPSFGTTVLHCTMYSRYIVVQSTLSIIHKHDYFQGFNFTCNSQLHHGHIQTAQVWNVCFTNCINVNKSSFPYVHTGLCILYVVGHS